MHDDLGDRMKKRYENRTRYYLPRRTYTLLRIDGKSFHTYTKGFKRPFDEDLMDAMNITGEILCHHLSGSQFAYIQSDEISILLTDFDKPATEAWFDGNVQKITSVSASIATAAFNTYIGQTEIGKTKKAAFFDSRVFTIPDSVEVENYFIWRQKDWTRNSITAVAQSLYSHRELHGKNTSEMQEMIFQKGQNWNNLTIPEKRGRIVRKGNDGKWFTDNEIPIFTQQRDYLSNMIPKHWEETNEEL